MRNWAGVLCTLVCLVITTSMNAAPTNVTVRAVSRDAKVIGDLTGGARITIRDVESGKVLASGVQKGGTGDTKQIMQTPRTRGAVVYDSPSAAAFRATLDLTHPTKVEIVAEGPLQYPQAIQKASKTMLLIPGRHITGDGVVLEIAGFIVDVPPSIEAKAGQPIPVRARIVMTCGCPTEPGGMWNADQFTVTAAIRRNGKTVEELPLTFAGQTSMYQGSIDRLDPGTYEVEILASDVHAANFGRAVATLTVK